jgi:hypothetical protein
MMPRNPALEPLTIGTLAIPRPPNFVLPFCNAVSRVRGLCF